MEIFGNHDVQLNLGGVICSRVSAYLFGATILIQRNQKSTSWGTCGLFHDLRTMSCAFAGCFIVLSSTFSENGLKWVHWLGVTLFVPC